MEQYINKKIFVFTLLLLLVLQVMSFIAYFFDKNIIFFIVAVFLISIALFYQPEWSVPVVLGELTIGGKGYLLAFDFEGFTVSLRMAIFIIVIAVFLIDFLSSKKKSRFFEKNFFSASIFLLAATITIGAINGLLNNSLYTMLFDVNGWLFFALLPIFLNYINNKKQVINVTSVFMAGATLTAIITIILFTFFSYVDSDFAQQIYRWLTVTGTGEITNITSNVFRVFMQSQIFTLLAIFIALPYFFQINFKWNRKIIIFCLFFYILTFAILISQSRSFWVGAMVAFLFILFVILKYLKIPLFKTALITVAILVALASQTVLMQAITGNVLGNIIGNRISNLNTEPAGSSRINQLRPLAKEILKKPLSGHGFGKTITYISNDPRIVESYPNREYTTYAFEWGYLDIWTKIGLIGLVAYIWLLGSIMYLSLKIKKQPEMLFFYGLAVSTVALGATSFFTPYLNHPLGIGFIMFSIAIIFYNQTKNSSANI